MLGIWQLHLPSGPTSHEQSSSSLLAPSPSRIALSVLVDHQSLAQPVFGERQSVTLLQWCQTGDLDGEPLSDLQTQPYRNLDRSVAIVWTTAYVVNNGTTAFIFVSV
jgi:hypothetical protein